MSRTPTPPPSLSLDEALDIARTGDLWLFRGRTPADRAIQMTTNAPVNHVGMTVALDDLPALMWHAELGRSLTDVWSGKHQRGVQLHDLRAAVSVWATRYGQRAWLRQLEPTVSRSQEEAVLRTVARLDGTPFPSMARLASRWVVGHAPFPRSSRADDDGTTLESAYCAEVVALTYDAMGLLDTTHARHSYDPGNFWSGDHLALADGTALGGEIAVEVPL